MSSGSVLGVCMSGSSRTGSAGASCPAEPRPSPPSCVRPASGCGSWRRSWRSCGRAAKFLGEDKPRQKALPGDRPGGRRRDPGREKLPGSRGVQAELLQGQAHAGDTHAAAPPVAHGADWGDPCCLPRHLRLPARPCRADDGDGHQVQLAAGLRDEVPGRDLWPSRAGAGQTVAWRGDRRGPGQPQVPPATPERAVGYRHHGASDARRQAAR